MKSFLVIGLGRFGKHLAMRLMELGNEVLVIDKDEDSINKISPFVTQAMIGDCMDADVLRSLGVSNFDVCFVCISDYFQSSLEITSLLDELGAKRIVSKADREIHEKFLLKVGADEVISPEKDMAGRAAVKYSMKNAYDYFELSPEYAIMEMQVPDSWVGKSIAELRVSSRYNVVIIGGKGNNKVTPIINTSYTFNRGEHIVVAGRKIDIIRLNEKA